MDSKVCCNCEKELTIDNFHKSKSGKFGVRGECKECYNKKNKERNNPPNADVSIKQTCTGICARELPATTEFFHKSKRRRFGVRSKCRECRNKINNPINTDASIKQTCTDCNKEFSATLEYFHRSKCGKFGVRAECKECYNKRNNPPNEDINIKQVCSVCGEEKPATLEYFYRLKSGKFGVASECKECYNKKVKQWKKDNRDKVREYHNEYIKNKYQNDQQYRIRRLLSGGLRRALNNIGQSKNASILDYIGCDIEFLKQHLNNTKDNSWGDVELHIDHIIPVSLYDHTNKEEIKKCWNWRNLRYFPKSDNISKGDILDMSLVKQYGIDDLLPDF